MAKERGIEGMHNNAINEMNAMVAALIGMEQLDDQQSITNALRSISTLVAAYERDAQGKPVDKIFSVSIDGGEWIDLVHMRPEPHVVRFLGPLKENNATDELIIEESAAQNQAVEEDMNDDHPTNGKEEKIANTIRNRTGKFLYTKYPTARNIEFKFRVPNYTPTAR